MAHMGKQDNIFEGGNLSGLPFTFNQEVTEVFEDMIDRSVPGYKTSLSLIAHNARRYYQSNTNCYDVGCSLGASSLSILQGAKDAKVTAIDNSEAMIEECERRFKNLTESFHIKFICEDIMDSSLSDASIVVVNYVIQFLILIITYITLDFLTLMIYGLAAEKISVWLRRKPKVLNTISACVLLILAVYIAATQKF